MYNERIKKRWFTLLQIATVAVFLGRAWQHLVWDAPFRTLLWDEELMKGIVESVCSIPWDEYITSPETDAWTQNLIKSFGWFYLLCAVMAVMIKRWKRVASFFMWFGSFSLVMLAMLYCKERFYSVGQFFEYALQFSSPLFLYYALKPNFPTKQFIYFLKIAIAFTFVCHGLYAIGYYPRPGYFTEMTMNILGVEEDRAIQFLKMAGILDFVIGVGIFVPKQISKWIIIYAILWGFFTTLARVAAYVEVDYFTQTMKQWLHETIYRFPHFLLPLVLYFLVVQKLKND